ncbi:hypothetical protein BH09ACT2_BH09ACT2_10710 [soil metagenome]
MFLTNRDGCAMTQNNGLIVIAVVLGAGSSLGLYLTY